MKDELHLAGSIGNSRRTIRDAVESFSAIRAMKNLAQGTLDYDEWLAKLILEGLGPRKLDSLTVADCDRFLVACAGGLGDRRPIGRSHMSRLRQRLIAVLRNEMRTGHLNRNVAELSILPSIENDLADDGEGGWTSDRRSLTADELRLLSDAAEGSRLVLIDLCGRNALRPAEARALRWSDLDLDRQELSIRSQQDRSNRRTKVKRAHNASRTISIDETTQDRILTWRTEIEAMREQAGPAWVELDVVAATVFGTPVDRYAFARSMRTLCQRIDVDPITPYELRHTAISLQADAGRSSWEIADWAGTSEAMISSRYRHRLRRVSSLRPADRVT